jgi:putative oxidoreductase
MQSEETVVRSTNPLTILLTHKSFIFLLRVVIGGLFLYSSAHKILHPDQFAIAIRGYELMPLGLTNAFALFVAWSELVAGVMLLFGVMTKKAAGAILILLVMFTIAILSTMIRGMAIDCGCFSNEGGSETNITLVIRNLFLIAGSVMVMLFDRGSWSLSSAFARRR